MAGGAKFVPNGAGIRALGTEPAMIAFLEGIGQAIAAVAEGSAPYRDGYLSGSIEVESVGLGGRIAARVNVTDFKGHWHEFGTEKMAAQPYLWPATEQILAGRALLVEGRGEGGA